VIEKLDSVIRAIEHEWNGKKILVIGDLMLDRYISGEVKRISPEAPVPVVIAKNESYQPGGAGNVSMNLARLGAMPTVIGFTGTDENGVLLSRCLTANGIIPRLIQCAEFPTTTKLRIIGGRQQMLRLDTESTAERTASAYERLINDALQVLPDSDAVVLSDYAKGTLNRQVCQAIVKQARKLGIPVLVDPKSADFSIYQGATTICPNLTELSIALRESPGDNKLLLERAQSLVRDYGFQFLIATLSEKGIALVRSNGLNLAPAQARQVFDVSGAGDTVVAVMALSLASGLEPESGIQLANMAAGIVVGKVGTVPVEKHELIAALSAGMTLHTKEKLLDLDELLARVALWKKTGERVVFTNGCFDLLHVGHIAVIETARSFGDRLIVGLNTDASVRKLKGSGRPIVGGNERARVIAAIGAVDAVVLFDEETPLNLIKAIHPDVLVKGGDYRSDSIVGGPEVESWGGQVKVVPTLEGFSTTRLIEAGNKPV